MDSLKEYVITLKNSDDLNDFYEDMEMLCHGKSEIPDRMIECCNRRVISRNTHYLLTDEEASKIKNDPRVKNILLHPKHLGIKAKPSITQTSDYWDKSSTVANDQLNWGLLRCVNGEQISGWGRELIPSVSGSVTLTSSGINVDVVIVDGFFFPNHPEFKENIDGTGESRFIDYNWFQHNPVVTGEPASGYIYDFIIDSEDPDRTADNNHGCHVAGTVVGSRQGWAKSANIYNISPYSTDPNLVDTLNLIDYIREFHRNKPINPTTGLKNPTITNHSWGFSYNPIYISNITQINYRGTIYTPPFTNRLVEKFGLIQTSADLAGNQTVINIPADYEALNEDIQDAIDEGILFVGAAGNTYYKADVPTGSDYNNYLILNNTSIIYYNRGSSPSSASRVINVGSIESRSTEYKSYFSISGPRVDIYAPGENILSAFNTSDSNIFDSRDPSFWLNKLSGTSMASPQVCGVLACVLEQYPEFKQEDARDYLNNYSKKNQILNYDLNLGTYFSDVEINSIAYGNGIYVMVGDSGQGSVSLDGLDWTPLPAGNDTGLKFGGARQLGDILGIGTILDVNYVNDKFIAVGHSGKASYSVDGINWTSLPAGDTTGIKFGVATGVTALNNSGRSTAFGASTYVIVGSNGKASYSSDGINWTSLLAGDATGIRFGTSWAHKVIFANNLFLVVGDGGKASYSSNGVTWTPLTAGDLTGLKFGTSVAYSVAYGNGVFVVVGSSGKASYSSDGINWTSLTAGTDTGIKFGTSVANDITFGNGKFVVVGYDGKASYSTDGINWTSLPAGTDTGIKFGNSGTSVASAISYSDNKFIVGGWLGQASYSADGISWTKFGNSLEYAYYSLQNSSNNYLFYYKERKESGNVFPKTNIKIRPSSGITFPRQRIRFRK